MSNHNAPRRQISRASMRRMHTALHSVLGMPLGDTARQTRLLKYLARPMSQIKRVLPQSNQGVTIDTKNFGDVKGEWVIPDNAGPTKIVYYHGGGFVSMHPALYRSLTVPLARQTGCRVFVPGYRLAPEHPFPLGLNDCVGAYTQLLHAGNNPSDIVLAGDSAGGNYVLAVMLRLIVGGVFPLPLCGIALSPWLDLTSGHKCPSRVVNAEKDWVLPVHNAPKLASLYCPGPDSARTEPYVSPLFAPAPLLEKIPPMYFEVSGTEILYDDSRLMHQKLPTSRLHVWEDEPHTFQIFGERYGPAMESFKRIRAFISDAQKGTVLRNN